VVNREIETVLSIWKDKPQGIASLATMCISIGFSLR
ncbi:hypothetical protein CCACVL1_24521, partial [Corchorus capsularis]